MEPNTPQFEAILSVTEFTARVRHALEGQFGNAWVEGEIFSLSRPSSGHVYFQLRDGRAVLAGVLFKSAAQRVRIPMANGLRIQCRGRMTYYEPQGRAQMVIEEVRPAGQGTLLVALEGLKRKLAAEGLFDAAHKKPLPLFPGRVGVVTSPTGAAIRDIVRSIHDRFPVPILLAPVRVQGEGAAAEIARAIQTLDAMEDVDVLIVGRGGGSLEDLWAFHEETVVRAIFHARLPVVSAVGHEVDFLLSDLVADVRAPTPTGAGALVVPSETVLRSHLAREAARALRAQQSRMAICRSRVANLASRLHSPRHALEVRRGLVDEWEMRAMHAAKQRIATERSRLERAKVQLRMLHPSRRFEIGKERLERSQRRLLRAFHQRFSQAREDLRHLTGQLRVLGPEQVLQRGFAIVRQPENGPIIRQVEDAPVNCELEVQVVDGTFRVVVTAPPG